MKKLTIQSTSKQTGNVGNMDHEISVKLPDGQRIDKSITLKLSNYWADGKTYPFNISREAAIELMLALDIILDVEEEILEDPRCSAQLLTDLLRVVKAAKNIKFIHLSSWDVLGKGEFYQYRDQGELVAALRRLAAHDHTCPKHPGASPPCSEDTCECYGRAMDLAGAYQSILDGRM